MPKSFNRKKRLTLKKRHDSLNVKNDYRVNLTVNCHWYNRFGQKCGLFSLAYETSRQFNYIK